MADDTSANAAPSSDHPSVGEVIDYVKTYARQETVGPLRGAGRWIGMGAAGAASLGLGLSLLLLGVLRVLQTEVSDIAEGKLSWLPYLIVLIVTLALLALTMMQIDKTFLNKEDQ